MTFKYQMTPIINTMSPNSVADFKDYHLSYNQSSRDYGSDTTALVLNNTVFLLLNGDHRDAMHSRAEAGGLQACFDYFVENIEKANHMGEHKQVVNGCKTFPFIRERAVEILGDENIARLQRALTLTEIQTTVEAD